MKDISVQELKEKMDNNEHFVLIDVREPHENEAFNIGGELIPLGNVPQAIEDLAEEHEEDEVVVYCRTGRRSAAAKEMLKQAGLKNVRNLEGGVVAWVDAFGQ